MRRFTYHAVGSLGGFMLIGLLGCQNPNGGVKPTAQKTDPPTPTNVRPEATPQLNAASYFAFGHLQERQGAFESAMAQYRKALAANPAMVTARNRLAITLNKVGRHAEAAAEFRTALKTAPNEAHLHNNLGFTLLLQGQFAAAETELRRALTLKSDFQRARMNLGIALAKLERFDDALNEMRRACGEADACYNLGVLYAEAHHYSEAAKYMELALAANPRLDAARKQLPELTRLAANESMPSAAGVTIEPAALLPEAATNGATGSVTLVPTPKLSVMPENTPGPGGTVNLDRPSHTSSLLLAAESGDGGTTTNTEHAVRPNRADVEATLLTPAWWESTTPTETTPSTTARTREEEANVVMARLLLKLTRQVDAQLGNESNSGGQDDERSAELQTLMTQIYDALQTDTGGIEELLCKFEDRLFPGLADGPCSE